MEISANMEKAKSGSFAKMPRFSKTSRWILSLGAFLIIFFLLFTLTNQEKARTEGLQKALDASRTKVIAPAQDITALQDTLDKERQLLQNAQSQFPGSNSSIQMLENFIKLADSCGLEITGSALTVGIPDKAISPVYRINTYTLQLDGEAARVPNFILGLSKFPATEIISIDITPALVESGVDSATITLDCLVKD